MAEASERLTAAHLDATAWIAAVSHDLRDPMNAILGMTRLLLETPLDATQRSYAEVVDDAANAMLSLINDLLDITRLQRGEMRVDVQPFALEPLLDRSLDWVRARAAAKGLELALEVAEDVPRWVAGDAGRVRQILVNLLVNAMKCTPSGTIALHAATSAPGCLRLTVEDTGPGFSAGDRERLLRPFEQGAGEAGGVGLGLAIVHLLVERLGGQLWLEDRPGGGARIVVDLPLPGITAPASPRRSAVAGRRVWLVDRAGSLRQRTATALEALGLQVRCFDSLDSVDDAAPATAEAPDAILLATSVADAELAEAHPGAAAAGPATVRFALVETGFRGEAAAWRRAGFDGYLPYPLPADALRDALGLAWGQGTEDPPFITTHTLDDRALRPLHVLVVDDNPLNARLATVLLERVGHRVTTAADGGEAVAAVARGGIDAVLMDIQMPGMDGIEATRRIRALGGPLANVPVIAVTAKATPADLQACREAAMDDVVTKPIEPAGLLAALAYEVERRAAGGGG